MPQAARGRFRAVRTVARKDAEAHGEVAIRVRLCRRLAPHAVRALEQDGHVLATSREPLHLSGEWEFEVPALRVPADVNDPLLTLQTYDTGGDPGRAAPGRARVLRRARVPGAARMMPALRPQAKRPGQYARAFLFVA